MLKVMLCGKMYIHKCQKKLLKKYVRSFYICRVCMRNDKFMRQVDYLFTLKTKGVTLV